MELIFAIFDFFKYCGKRLTRTTFFLLVLLGSQIKRKKNICKNLGKCYLMSYLVAYEKGVLWGKNCNLVLYGKTQRSPKIPNPHLRTTSNQDNISFIKNPIRFVK